MQRASAQHHHRLRWIYLLQECHTIILYECPHCYAVVRFKGANHNCPEEEEEGLGPDIINNII